MNTNDFTSFLHPKIYCEKCNFKCFKNGDWNRHILTAKHKKLTNTNDFTSTYIKHYKCYCGKSYKHMSSLCAHKKKCSNTTNLDKTNTDSLLLHLLKQNGELQNKIIQMASQINTITNSNNINTTNINKNFNLTLFLNETCKNAMNITDFVSSIKLNLDDLENTGRCGYVEGISNIIIKNLNNLEQHMRPLHCSDPKREILYIKDNNEWLKEIENKPILTKAIKTIANENIKQITKWKNNYNNCTDSNSINNDLYLKIVSNSMNGVTKEEGDKNINKIITNLAKKVTIEK